VDWGELTPRLRPGDRVCTTHGRVRAEQAPIGIPVCTHCRQMMSTVTFKPDGTLQGFAEPAPDRCAAAERHPLVGGAVTVSWLPCVCPAALDNQNGHRAWRCSACTKLGRPDATLRWPPCTLSTDG
jgi:hypothetical protein